MAEEWSKSENWRTNLGTYVLSRAHHTVMMMMTMNVLLRQATAQVASRPSMALTGIRHVVFALHHLCSKE